MKKKKYIRPEIDTVELPDKIMYLSMSVGGGTGSTDFVSDPDETAGGGNAGGTPDNPIEGGAKRWGGSAWDWDQLPEMTDY